jgi:protein-S-isoprenylcysteine O-methyltransferase Ste14
MREYVRIAGAARELCGGENSMSMVYEWLIPVLWTAFGIYWWIAARGTKKTERIESTASQIAHFVPLGIAIYLVVWRRLPGDILGASYLMPQLEVPFFVIGAVLTAAGLVFAVWARLHIGRNWSGTVTVKQGHELIRNGPYRFVRHPIYSGLLLAIVGSAIARGEWRGLAAIVVAFVSLWRKLRLEERWMSEVFGEAYARYRAEVRALIPLLF